MRHFSLKEFACKCGCGGNSTSARILELADDLREEYGHVIRVVSGYRCEQHNREVKGVAHGPHTRGEAMDISVRDPHERMVLVRLALNLGFSGVGLYASKPGCLHLDVCEAPGFPRPSMWVYE